MTDTTEPRVSLRFTNPFARTPCAPLDTADRALLELGHALKGLGYCFTTITPASHARVIARPSSETLSLTDIFGWSRRFRSGQLDSQLAKLASRAEVLELRSGWLKSSVRFSTLGNQLYAHSAYPTHQADAVFFGPDTYRFARLISSAIAGMQFRCAERLRILDVGAGSGAGGLHAAALASRTSSAVTLTDVNPRALRCCRINAALNGIDNVHVVESDLFANISGSYDLIIANPPYLVDPRGRTYRHGGGHLGSDLSVRFVEAGISRLARGGRLVLYTGSAIVDGRDYLRETLSSLLRGRVLRMSYEEIDPDVFGEELDHPPYDRADRIAVVGVIIDLPEGDENAPGTR
ncbi:MAG TPA: class I SAM-dependent methyltransferase [Steroidobacteraceae bacterium]